jgi:hypothetical protein
VSTAGVVVFGLAAAFACGVLLFAIGSGWVSP